MKIAQDFAATRIAAQHCPELVERGPRPEEREAQIVAWRRDLAAQLAATIGALLPGDRVSAEVGAPEWLSGPAVLALIGPVAANSLLRCGVRENGGEGAGVLLSLDHATALALAERSFGGEGRVGEPIEDPLPRSALLMSDEVARAIAQALAKARLGGEATGGFATAGGEVILRSESAARLRAIDPASDCALVTLRLASHEGCVWLARLAAPKEAFERLLPAPVARAAPPGRQASGAASFGAIPLNLRGVLAEIDLTLSQLSRLAPGDTIPLAMPRAVPLHVGDALLGYGSIGTLDDRIALRLTQLPFEGITP
jgi:flagellar motor switch protein FliM